MRDSFCCSSLAMFLSAGHPLKMLAIQVSSGRRRRRATGCWWRAPAAQRRAGARRGVRL